MKLAFDFTLPSGAVVRRLWNDTQYHVYVGKRLAFSSANRGEAIRFAKSQEK